MTERCAECRFWKQDAPAREFGECHRYAPRESRITLSQVIAPILATLVQIQAKAANFDLGDFLDQPTNHAEAEAFGDGVCHAWRSIDWPETHAEDFCGEFDPKRGT